MISTELLQALGIGAGLCVFAGIIVGAIKLSKAVDAIWPACATRYGLSLDEQRSGNPMTAQRSAKSLAGTIRGVPVRVIAMREQVGNRKSLSTRLLAKALHPAPHRFSAQIERGPGTGPSFHLVQTGDAQFDRQLSIRSDSPDLVRALMTAPVRTALLAIPMGAVGLSYDGGELCLSWGGYPHAQNELDAPLEVIVAMGQARLA